MRCLPPFVAYVVWGTALTGFAQTSVFQQPANHDKTAPAAEVPPIPPRIAVVVFQAAVSQTNEFQRDFANLQKKYDPRREQLKTLGDQIETLTKQLEDQGASLNDQERATRARAIDEKRRQLDRDAQDAQSDFQSEMQELVNRIASKVGTAISEYVQRHGYTLLLDASQEQQGPAPVLYWTPSSDITKAVVEAYNQKSGVPPPPASAAPDAAKPSRP